LLPSEFLTRPIPGIPFVASKTKQAHVTRFTSYNTD
jgi:hypothetical protein